MTITGSLGSGLAGAWRRPKLVAVLWAWNLALGIAATLPLAAWLRQGLDFSSEADLLLQRYSFGLMGELMQEAGPAPAMTWAAVVGALLLALLSNPLLAGGMLEVLGSHDQRSLLHRFFRGGGHFYGRFLRLLLLSTVAMAVVAGLAGGALAAALRPLRESGWEPGPEVAALLVATVVLAIVALFWLGLDYARIEVSRHDGRYMLRALLSGLRFTLHYRGRTFGLLALGWLLLLVLLAGYLGLRQAVPSHTAGLIALMIALQQAFILLRLGLRLALVGAERELHLALRPAVGLEPVVTTWEPPLPAPDPFPRRTEDAGPLVPELATAPAVHPADS